MRASVLALSSILLQTAFGDSAGCQKSHAYPAPNSSNTAFIPFTKHETPVTKHEFPTSEPMLDITVSTQWNKAVRFPLVAMDTGSTGFAISAKDLGLQGTDFDRNSSDGFVYLSSSRRLWRGRWIDADVAFRSDADLPVVARIPVLAVTRLSFCGRFSEGNCYDETDVADWPTGIRYLGVGFGRWSAEQPQASPDKVPFTNVVSIGGRPVKGIHSGYVINRLGIEVGLTSANAEGFAMTQLNSAEDSEGDGDADWQMARVGIRIASPEGEFSPWDEARALFDTGINKSYVRVHQDVLDHVTTERWGPRNSKVLVPGSRVQLRIPARGEPIVASYEVTVGDPESPMDAWRYVIERPAPEAELAYINTGRFFYKGFDLLFNAKSGWLGLRSQKDAQLAPVSDRHELSEL